MPALDPKLRRELERTIVEARGVAVAGVDAALRGLTVHEGRRGTHLSEAEAQLRNRLRAHAKQIGDLRDPRTDAQAIDRLVQECAYEQWHRMLFARFLAENDFLVEPQSDVAVTLEEVEELAQEAGVDRWELAGEYAAKALPAIFRTDDPLLQVKLSRETRLKLENLLESLPVAVFKADDSLGWVYQFWQSEEKERVNKQGEKINGQTLPAVTQLFTEHYMVLFLLHNTLGAWHAGKVLASQPELVASAEDEDELRRMVRLESGGGYDFEYLRFIKVEEASSLSSPIPTHAPLQPAFPNSPSIGTPSEPEFTPFDWAEPVEVLSGNLPHVRQEGVTYFVTFRAADSLPAEKWKQWQQERDAWLRDHPKPHDAATKSQYAKKFTARIHYWLDQKYGECLLTRTDARSIVEDALRHFHGERYRLDEFVVAANHVHVLVTPLAGHELSDILHSWKSFTANEINKVTGRSGAYWQKESFDHAVRSPESVARYRQYIRNHHPVDEASSLLPSTPNLLPSAESAPLQNGGGSASDQNQGFAATVNVNVTVKIQDGSSTWRPMGGTFDGWPRTAAELKVLDPSCGSGHFLVAAFEILVRLRMHEEGLDVEQAIEAVLRDNLFGLEIDPRCTQIAAFNLAMAAWKLIGPQRLPPMRNIACSGIPLGNSRDEWMKSIPPTVLDAGLGFHWGQLYDMFSHADTLGSLINPQRFFGDNVLHPEQLGQLGRALSDAIASDPNAASEKVELAAAAQGLTRATELLAGRYTLVITNVPYLGRGKQDDVLKEYLETQYPLGKADLATAFVLRCLEFCSAGGSTALVTPQNWLFLTTYKKLRKKLLENRQWDVVARLGPGAFETIGGHVVNVALFSLTATHPGADHSMAGIDASSAKQPDAKAAMLRGEQAAELVLVPQDVQLKNPDARIAFTKNLTGSLLIEYVSSIEGLSTGDSDRYILKCWEVQVDKNYWVFFIQNVDLTCYYGGRTDTLRWEGASGALHASTTAHNFPSAIMNGRQILGRRGVRVTQMGLKCCTIYDGEIFGKSGATIVPHNEGHLEAVWSFCSSPGYADLVAQVDSKLNVTNASLAKVPFNLIRWQQVADETYPLGLPEPESNDPTQWLFHGCPEHSTAPLQVAVARLLGYRWPAELDSEMRLSQRARELVARCGELDPFVDDDGIACLPSVRGEDPAADRLLRLLSAVDITPSEDLDDWLRNRFFQQHCELFHQRPFIWHIWDGRRDGFSALINYHKLAGPNGAKLLESLTYSYLGDWILSQEGAVKANEAGADARLAAARELQQRLIDILHGEPPLDIFVRWKPLHEQPIGWHPDINDGVRMNIRPFMAADISGGRKGAGVLRFAPKIKWTKDRGKEPKRPIEDYPWFWSWDEKTTDFTGGSTFTGERWNDCHYTNAFKLQARQRAKERAE